MHFSHLTTPDTKKMPILTLFHQHRLVENRLLYGNRFYGGLWCGEDAESRRGASSLFQMPHGLCLSLGWHPPRAALTRNHPRVLNGNIPAFGLRRCPAFTRGRPCELSNQAVSSMPSASVTAAVSCTAVGNQRIFALDGMGVPDLK